MTPKVQRKATLVPRAAASTGDMAEQMAANERRWQDQVRAGTVKSISPKIAGDYLKEGWVLLDVRPPNEVEKAGVAGAVNVPLYVPESWDSVGNLIKHSTAIGMGGWWLGGVHMKPNQSFMAEVQDKVPKDAKVIVACQKGLRSLAAAEQLSRAGYSTLAWVNGGLDTAGKKDLPLTGADDLRYAGIGGLSEMLGWTDVQRERGAGFLGGSQNIIYAAIGVLVLDGLWVAYDQVTALLAK